MSANDRKMDDMLLFGGADHKNAQSKVASRRSNQKASSWKHIGYTRLEFTSSVLTTSLDCSVSRGSLLSTHCAKTPPFATHCSVAPCSKQGRLFTQVEYKQSKFGYKDHQCHVVECQVSHALSRCSRFVSNICLCSEISLYRLFDGIQQYSQYYFDHSSRENHEENNSKESFHR